ncbi:SGNH/GDSL hydrolase family protein [Aquimarina latercula]|uniref:SGNH/GDSL hydrolase family protein n=1 Tax=Aquimarina latercula TaxID=987 RepID=UPI00048366DD|nr:SGNH/GDSL hydrolase family protein [Aquimarina latercula]
MKEYSSIFLKIIKFVIIILIVDVLLGIVSNQIFFLQETGKYARANHTIYETEAEVLIFGSSHAHRHYVPEVLEKQLHTTAYNAGAEGQQLLYHLAMQEMLLKRSTPDLFILNIDEDFLYSSDIAYDRLNDLHPYYSEFKDELRPIFRLNSKFIDVEMFFKSYLLNSTIIHILRYYVSPQLDYKGYRPLHGITRNNQIKNDLNNIDDQSKEIDENFVFALKEFIDNSKSNKVDLVFVISPALRKIRSNNKSLALINKISKEEEVPILDFSEDKNFNNKLDWFHDPSHLNDKGARYFTKLVSERINQQNSMDN